MNTNGIGLGLCICKSICQIFGGNISVKSKLNVGSIFTIYFKLEEFYCETILNLQLKRINDPFIKKEESDEQINGKGTNTNLDASVIENHLKKFVKVINPDIKKDLNTTTTINKPPNN